jgi:hypothetical protein
MDGARAVHTGLVPFFFGTPAPRGVHAMVPRRGSHGRDSLYRFFRNATPGYGAGARGGRGSRPRSRISRRSRAGGAPNRRLYSRLNCDGLW